MVTAEYNVYYRVQLRETIIYTYFLILTIHMGIQHQTEEHYFLAYALDNQFNKIFFDNTYGCIMTLPLIRTDDDFWLFYQNLLIPNLYDHFYNSTNNITSGEKATLYDNKILGKVRMRQVRVRNDTCMVLPVLSDFYNACYADFSPEFEETAPIYVDEFKRWVHTVPPNDENIIFKGKYNSYTAGGYNIDLPWLKSQALQEIEFLKTHNFIDLGTRAIFIDFILYNANSNVFCLSKLLFEFPATGGIIPSTYFYSGIYIGESPKLYLVEIPFGLCILYFLFTLIWELFHIKIRKFLSSIWNILLIIIIIIYFYHTYLKYHSGICFAHIIEKVRRNEFPYFEYAKFLKQRYCTVTAMLLFFIVINSYQFLSFNSTMNLIGKTFKECFHQALPFLVLFLPVFLLYTTVGCLLFGKAVYEFHDFWFSMITLFESILGNFGSYNSMEEYNRILAPVFFLSFFFIVFLILLNMFLAVINGSYTDVKSDYIYMNTNKLFLIDYIKGVLNNWFGSKIRIVEEQKEYRLMEEIRVLLRKAGFSTKEIEMFMDRYNIHKNAKISINAETIISQYKQNRHDEQFRLPSEQLQPLSDEDFQKQEEVIDEIQNLVDKIESKVENIYEQYYSKLKKYKK